MTPIESTGAPGPFWSRLLTRRVQLLLDLGLSALAFVAAYLLRFEFTLPAEAVRVMLVQLPLVILVQLLALSYSGVYAFLFRYVGLHEARAFAVAAGLSFVPLLGLRLLLPNDYRDWRVPLSVLVIDTMLAFGGFIGLRVGCRSLHERWERAIRGREASLRPPRRVLVVGAGHAGSAVAREIKERPDLGLVVCGFVDDDAAKRGKVVHGLRVLGTTSELPRLARERAVDHVVLAVESATRAEIRRIMALCEEVPVKARILPSMHELVGGTVEVSRIRDVDIADLLGRAAVELDPKDIARLIAGRVVVVTGAGGSIGTELSRQVARFAPRTLILIDRAEGALFDVDRALRAVHPDLPVVAIVADVTDASRMRASLASLAPNFVLHAAAHKHVPLMETNAAEAVRNNVFGTKVVAELSRELGADAFVLVSTDKAVRPRSVMGATKRVAELVIQDLASGGRGPTRFLAVRFGNVIGSAGSVVPLFREQILAGGPVRVTHPDMVRYFMTIPEAAQLVLQAAAMGEGGELFVLDMGEPVRIVDLASDMIRLFGLRPHDDIAITFTGVRPGEKLGEELVNDSGALRPTRHPKILRVVNAGVQGGELAQGLVRLSASVAAADDTAVRSALTALAPESSLGPLALASPAGR